MTFSPEDAYASNVPVPDDSQFDTGGLELEPLEGESTVNDSGGLELVPMTGAEEVVEKVYTAEQQAADADRYRVNPGPEQVSHAGERPSSEMFAQAESVADRERSEQVSRVENLNELFDLLTSWGDRIPRPEGGTVYIPYVLNHIKMYRSGEKKISLAALNGEEPILGDITRANGVRDKAISLFVNEGFMYTDTDGVKKSMLEGAL